MAIATGTAIGLGISAAAAGSSMYAQHKQNAAMDDAKNTSQAGATANAGQMSNLSKYLMQQSKIGAPAYGKAIDYYGTMLGQGGRGKMQQAVAPAAGQIADTAKGAQMNLERMGIQGGQKVQAMAELNRQKAGQISNLTMGVQPGAAAQLGQLGAQGVGFAGTALQGLGGAGSLYSNLLQQQVGMANTQYDRDKEFGGALGGLVTSGLKDWQSRRAQSEADNAWKGVPYRD